MSERVKNFLFGVLGTATILLFVGVLYGGYLAYRWSADRYAEFTLMRAVTVAVVCKDYAADAPKLGIQCGTPQPGQGADPSGNATPGGPAPAAPPATH